MDLKNGTRDLLPGSLMIVTLPGPVRYYLPEDSSHWEFVFLTMVGREVIRISRIIEKRWGNIIQTEKLPNTLVLLYETLRQLFFEESVEVQKEEEKTVFSDLIDFLRHNLHRDIPVSEMADIMRLSRSHFTRLFRHEMGMSPRVYLEDLRLKTAMGILLEENSTVKETAGRCGIGDENYFCRLFKKRYGISPGNFKKKELSCDPPCRI
jgi:AraC-like DNA-binding protein